MCWSKNVSIATFVIGFSICVGVGVYALKKGMKSLAVLSFGWIYVLLMQLAEFYVWSKGCNEKGMCGTPEVNRSTFVLNMLQPVVIYVLFMSLGITSVTTKVLASGVIVGYMAYVLWHTKSRSTISNDGGHLNYGWWGEYPYGGLIYWVCLISIILLLIRPMSLSITTGVYVSITLLLSMVLHSYGVASMWCWYAAFAPLVIGTINSFVS